MFKTVVFTIIFYILLIIFLKRKKQNKLLFCIAFAVLNFFVITNPYISLLNDRYSISFAICFISGIFFNIKELMIISLSVFIGLVFDGINYDISYIILDFVVSIFSMVFGYYIGKVLYKKNKINPFSSIIYGTTIASLYAILYLLYYSLLDVKAQSQYDLKYYIYVGIFVVILFIALLIIYLVEDKGDEEKNSIISIFIRRFKILLIILFFIMLFINNKIFSFYVINKNYGYINDGFELALITINEIEKKYGERSLYNSNEAITYISDWYTDANGGVFFLDENFNLFNKLSDYMKEEMLKNNITANGFKDIINYEENKLIRYTNNGNDVYAKYTKYKSYYIIVFTPIIEIEKNVIMILYLTSYAIMMSMFATFLLLFYSVNKNIVTRVQVTNSKLHEISKGDYDVVFDDTSSKELKELSEQINSTVKTLKNNIKEVKEKNKQELDLAKKIQESQLRTDAIEHIAFDVNAINIPAEEVGGDFYDYFYIDYKYVMFLIADVSGKGIPGAMFMIKAKNAIINFAKQKLPLDEIVKRTNESMCQNNDAMMFITSFFGVIDLRTGLLKYVNCGHNAPIICKKVNENNEVLYLETTQQRILGIDDETIYKVEDITLNEGDKITLYTDGVTEARDKNKNFYGKEKLKEFYETICYNKPKIINKKIIESVKDFSKGTTQFDDITLLTFLYTKSKNVIELDATEKDINVGKEFLNKFIKLYDISIDIERNLKIVYDEIYSNIKNYAYDNKGGELIFKVDLCEKDTIRMTFMDKGKEFNPIGYKNEKTEKNVEDKVDGGMGLMFCKNIMDVMEYERENGYNKLLLYKKFA